MIDILYRHSKFSNTGYLTNMPDPYQTASDSDKYLENSSLDKQHFNQEQKEKSTWNF